MTGTSSGSRPVVYLHVGPMKTGTTYLQQLMYANRDLLSEAGVFVPGESWARQLRAAQDLLGRGRWDPHVRASRTGAWDEVARQVRATPLPFTVISVEFLGGAGQHQIRRAVASLAPAEVRVVLTLRDMAVVLPGLWQTQVHNGARYDWAEFLHRVERPSPVPRLARRHRPEDVFRSTQDVPAMLARWGAEVGGEGLQVVTVPPPEADPAELWRRFAAVLGVDPAVASRPSPASNPSIGLEATELVRRVNHHIGRLPPSEYNATVKDHLALEVLAARAGQEGRADLTRSGYDLALRWNARVRRAVEGSGATVTGDLADLPVEPDPHLWDTLPDTPSPPDREELLDDAELAAAALDRLRRRRARQLCRLGRKAEEPPVLDPGLLRRSWEAAPDPVDAAATSLAGLAREAALLLRQLRRTDKDRAGDRTSAALRQ